MNVTRDNIDALNAVVTLNIEKADYEPKVNEELKNYAKRANVPGFRPGKAPFALIKRQFGKAVLADTVNKLFDETLNNYIKDNKLNIVGQPIPSEGQEPIDFDKEINDITYKFDLGLLPEISIDLEAMELPYHTVAIDDQAIEQHIDSLTQIHFKAEKMQEVSAKSMLKGKLSQEGGFSNETAVLSVNVIKDEAEKAKFVGAKLNGTVTFDIKKAYPNDVEVSYMLGISKEEAENVAGDYTLTINEITDYNRPALDQALFDAVFGEGNVKSEEEFRAKVKEDLEKTNTNWSDQLFAQDFRKKVLEDNKIELPEVFIKRWITLVNHDNEKFTPEVLENEFPAFLDELRWNSVVDSTFKKYDQKLAVEEILDEAKLSVRRQFAMYGIMNIGDEQAAQYATQMLKEREQMEQISRAAANTKLAKLAKSKAKLNNTTASRAEIFEKLK